MKDETNPIYMFMLIVFSQPIFWFYGWLLRNSTSWVSDNILREKLGILVILALLSLMLGVPPAIKALKTKQVTSKNFLYSFLVACLAYIFLGLATIIFIKLINIVNV